MLLARALFQRFRKVLVPLTRSAELSRPEAPTFTVILEAMDLRRRLLDSLGLPATRHNIDRLVFCALSGLSLRAFIRDPDVFFPDPLLADEGFFLATFAAHCERRHLGSRRQRRQDCGALLRLDADAYAPAIDALLDGHLSMAALRLIARQPSPRA